jgi:Tol biopolymer transport system component
MRPDGTDVRTVFTDPDIPVRSVSWSPDGNQLVADTDNSNPHAKGLWLIDFDRSARRLFSGDALSPAWSPNGQWIAFASEGQLLKIRPDGTGLTPMITDPLPVDGQVVAWEPAWSRDGTQIAFVVTQVGSTKKDIWVMDADGTDPRNVSNTPASEGSPSFF